MARTCDRFAFRTSPPMKLDVIAYEVMKSGHTMAYSVCLRSNPACWRFPDDLAAAATALCDPPRPLTYELIPAADWEWPLTARMTIPTTTPVIAIAKVTFWIRK